MKTIAIDVGSLLTEEQKLEAKKIMDAPPLWDAHCNLVAYLKQHLEPKLIQIAGQHYDPQIIQMVACFVMKQHHGREAIEKSVMEAQALFDKESEKLIEHIQSQGGKPETN